MEFAKLTESSPKLFFDSLQFASDLVIWVKEKGQIMANQTACANYGLEMDEWKELKYSSIATHYPHRENRSSDRGKRYGKIWCNGGNSVLRHCTEQ